MSEPKVTDEQRARDVEQESFDQWLEDQRRSLEADMLEGMREPWDEPARDPEDR